VGSAAGLHHGCEFDWLLKHSNADVNARDDSGDLALHRAIDAGNTRKVWMLLQRPSISINVRDSFGALPADVVAELADASVREEMQRLLAAKRDGSITMMPMPAVAATIPDAVLMAVRAGDTETVAAYSGNLNVRCADNVTVVQLALQLQPTARRLAMLRVLKTKEVDFDAPFGHLSVPPVVHTASNVEVDAETLAWLVNEGGENMSQRDADFESTPGVSVEHLAVRVAAVRECAVCVCFVRDVYHASIVCQSTLSVRC
jgi:hypothetical protein